MGISDGPQGSSGVDCSVGSIVWVRRRNGSWWPGRILGTNELSASHLMSPRSGTPVKLLGREDASVDWYNLEKSKRVKAFRCGEFDDCIERAESSQGIPIKKREKYARREDAILHALELERQQLEKQQQNLGVDSNCVSSKIPGGLDNELSTSPERLENAHGKVGHLKSYQLSKSLDLSLEEESMGNPLYAQKFKQGKQHTWEDENAEAMPRMRGLQDFGLRIASSKGKFSSSVTSDGSRNHTVDNDAHVLPNSGRSTGGLHQVNIGRSLLLKRKGPLGGSSEESLVKRRDRRRPLVQVLQSSAKLPVPNSLQYDGEAASFSMSGEEEQAGIVFRAKRSKCVYLPADSNDCMDQIEFPSNQMSPSQFAIDNCRLHPGSLTVENTSSGLKEDFESDSSEGDYLNPDMEEEMVALSDAATVTDAEPRNSGRYGFRGQQPGSMSNEEPDEWALTGYMSHHYPHGQSAAVAVDVGVSKWPLKGKRNTRNLLKRPVEVTDVKESNGSIHGKYLEGKGTHSREKASSHAFYHKTEALNYGYDEDDLIEKDFQSEMEGFGNRRCMLMSKAVPSDRSRIGHNIIGLEDSIWEADGLSQSTFRRYWDDPDECFDQVYVGHHIGKGIDSKLVEVDLKVQASSYQGEHVPLVSLMSRLNGKAIIGHPIQVEELEDGSSDILLSSNDDFGDGMVGNNSGTALPPVWRTARRTAMHRVPRPHALSAVEDDEAADYLHYSDNECKSLYAKSYAGNFGPKERQNSKRFSQLRHPATEKKLPKKLLKKASLSNQKTRTLSSIAIEQKHPGKGSRSDARKSCTDGLMKPGETGPTTVTCIPVKLVFSRLLEAVGRQPSRPANYGVLMNGNKEREPS